MSQIPLVPVREDGIVFNLTARARAETPVLAHPPVADPTLTPELYIPLVQRPQDQQLTFPWGQEPYVVTFSNEESRTRWSNYHNKFVASKYPVITALDFGNVVSERMDEELRSFYAQVMADDGYTWGIVSYTRYGSWSRCFEESRHRGFCAHAPFIILCTERDSNQTAECFYPALTGPN